MGFILSILPFHTCQTDCVMVYYPSANSEYKMRLADLLRKYSRGRRGAPAKGIGRETGARVQIPLSSPDMVLWSSGLSRLPVTEKIASSNLVRTAICECSSMVEHHLAKVDTAVQFRSLAPYKNPS